MIFDVASSKGGLSAARPAALKKWSVRAKSETLGQAKTSAEFLKLYMFLAERSLSPVTVKGIILRDLYPNPEQRISADEDLLISEGDFPKYHDALLDYGMSVVDPDTDTIKEHEISYCNGLLYLELHKKAFPDDSKAYGDLNRFFNDVEKKAVTAMVYGVPIKTMGYSDHLFYLICHAYKHFINCGIGIRYVSDIVLFSMAYLDKIEWALIKDLCEQIKASRFTSALYRIGEKYLFPECFPDVLVALTGCRHAEHKPDALCLFFLDRPIGVLIDPPVPISDPAHRMPCSTPDLQSQPDVFSNGPALLFSNDPEDVYKQV